MEKVIYKNQKNHNKKTMDSSNQKFAKASFWKEKNEPWKVFPQQKSHFLLCSILNIFFNVSTQKKVSRARKLNELTEIMDKIHHSIDLNEQCELKMEKTVAETTGTASRIWLHWAERLQSIHQASAIRIWGNTS